MTEVQTTSVSWRPDYNAERLMVRDWIDKDGWDFVGCVVDIQLRRADGDYFFVKYVGSVEGTDDDGIIEEGEELPRVMYKRRAWKKANLSSPLLLMLLSPKTLLKN